MLASGDLLPDPRGALPSPRVEKPFLSCICTQREGSFLPGLTCSLGSHGRVGIQEGPTQVFMALFIILLPRGAE